MQRLFCSLALSLAMLGTGSAASLFTDTFDSAADALWGNEVGAWSASGGVYRASAPDNFPNAHTSLPFNLTDFTLSLDIGNVSDGGIWLRSAPAGGTVIGRSGVLLVTLGTTFYFHNVLDGTSYGASFNSAPHGGGANPSVEVQVSGDTYSVFVNGGITPVTSYTTNVHSSGQVALYSNSASQSFDNVNLIPEPSAALLSLAGCGLLLRRRRS